MQDQLEKIREIGRKMGKTDEEIDREIAIGRKNAISGKMSAQMAISQMMPDIIEAISKKEPYSITL